MLPLGNKSDYIWEYVTPHGRFATEQEFDRMKKVIRYEFVNDGEKIQYSHKIWCSIGRNHSQKTRPFGICGGQIGNRKGFFPSTLLLSCHCHSVHTIILHTHLFIASFFNPSNGLCCLIRTLTTGLRHWKDHNFGGIISGKERLFWFRFYPC